MPRANTKDYYKTFFIECEASGSTPELVKEYIQMEIKHKKIWIKGTCTEGEVQISDALGGGYKATCVLSFEDKRYNPIDESTD